MSTAKCIGRVGALAVALGVGFAGSAASGVAAATEAESADSTALIMGGTTVPTPDDAYVETVMNHFIAPTHPTQPGETITPVAVTTPEEAWPTTGLQRLLYSAFGPTSIWGPGGPGWPD